MRLALSLSLRGGRLEACPLFPRGSTSSPYLFGVLLPPIDDLLGEDLRIKCSRAGRDVVSVDPSLDDDADDFLALCES